jgi:hypothetical protein
MKTQKKQVTENVEIIGNGIGWSARKINGGSIINEWTSKPTAIKRAKLIQEDIDAGLIEA